MVPKWYPSLCPSLPIAAFARTKKNLPIMIREILSTLIAAAITLLAFVVAIAFGVLVSVEVTDGSWLVGVLASVAFLLFVVLPVRLWWVMRHG